MGREVGGRRASDPYGSTMRGASLTRRLTGLVVLVVVITATVCLAVVLSRYNAQLVESRTAELDQEARLHGLALEGWVDELARDAHFLASLPPIQGIARTRDGQVDPLDGSSRALWVSRLDTIFREMAAAKPAYVQVRYIGVADGGREIVRVDRGPDGRVRSVPEGELQQKGGRTYLKETLARGEGEIYLSPVELNRERGVIQEPWLRVLRAGVPVYTESGELFGAVVINVSFDEVFKEFEPGAGFSGVRYLMDARGHYLEHPDPAETFGWEFDRPATGADDFPAVLAELRGEGSRQSSPGDAELVGHYILGFGEGDDARRYAWVVVESRASATAITEVVMREAALAVLVLLVLAAVGGATFARRISDPILRLADVMEEVDFDAPEIDMPDGLTGEAAVLASAFQSSYNKVRQQRTTLEANNQELGQFAYIASHDLQEPLRTITSFVDLLEDELKEELGEEPREWLRFITEAAARMRALIHGLLEYSRIGADDDERVPVDLNRVLQEAIADLGGVITEAKGRVEVGALPTIEGNPVSLRLLFDNLLSNAMRYRHPERDPVVRVSASATATGWQIIVSDNGIGIPEEQRERVFLIFQRLHADKSVGGTGIGLAHCKKIVDNHQGRIWIETSPQGGASFLIAFEGTV